MACEYIYTSSTLLVFLGDYLDSSIVYTNSCVVQQRVCWLLVSLEITVTVWLVSQRERLPMFILTESFKSARIFKLVSTEKKISKHCFGILVKSNVKSSWPNCHFNGLGWRSRFSPKSSQEIPKFHSWMPKMEPNLRSFQSQKSGVPKKISHGGLVLFEIQT